MLATRHTCSDALAFDASQVFVADCGRDDSVLSRSPFLSSYLVTRSSPNLRGSRAASQGKPRLDAKYNELVSTELQHWYFKTSSTLNVKLLFKFQGF